MQIFEFHFNPKLKPDLIFDSFCYTPENIYERKMGSLYMVGLLKNVLPKNLHFLEKLQKLIKEKYYLRTISTPEKSLKESLKEANEFLEGMVKRGDVSWLGNLNFAVLALKDFKLNFTKVGGIKIFLLRRGEIIDIDKKLRFQDIEPYPLKVFPNLVSGKLAENDLILVLTKEVADLFQTEGILNKIAKFGRFSENEFKEIFNEKKETLLQLAGICLAVVLTKEVFFSKREAILPQVKKEFSLKEVFSPILKIFKERLRGPVFPKITVLKPKFIVPKIKIKWNKNLFLVLALILTLIFGFVFAQLEKRQKIKSYQKDLEKIEEKINSAEGFLILKTVKTQKKANVLLKEGWEELTPILKDTQNLPDSFLAQVFDLRDEILDKLYTLNKLEEIEEPELFFEFKAEKFIPQQFLVSGDNLYFFSPYAKNLFKLDKNKNEEIISIDKKLNLTSSFDDSILFFSKPNHLTILVGQEQFLTNVDLGEPYPDFEFDDFSIFKENLYFFDKKAGQIIKYLYSGNFEWGTPALWLKRSLMGKSIAVDGSVWILGKDNSISKYYAGTLQEKLEIDIFPSPKDFTKIFTSPALPYLYILEPIQKRIIILSKTGEVIKQIQSEKFDNLLDFGVSKDGKIIWFLNGLKVYQISF